jgi:hypothetical protein
MLNYTFLLLTFFVVVNANEEGTLPIFTENKSQMYTRLRDE